MAGEQDIQEAGQHGAAPSGGQQLVFDFDSYRPHLAEFDLTEEQKRELLEALWSVLVAVVDLRFRLHPVQHANGRATDIPLDRILAAMLTSPEENPNNSNEITVPGEDRPSAEKEDS